MRLRTRNVSCIGLAAAVGLEQSGHIKGLYVAGIGLIVFSDTLISFSEFLRRRELNAWILPTYYLAHLCITATVLLARRASDPIESSFP
ncbi:MAG: hypothetical protein KA191_00850 [Verrucomicrobia bacterium]|jgi:Na+/H+-translocating membrane pyrophosphatase|nr:hypothetical protein [Verrucomicrobiota bacterium]OQC67924.1 MAG: YhhN-like protein [Verrucomicrobia bacterium ADurb.Bin006]MDI9381060.1 lysoplasmalogenase family protein [Verrucomicrobiota bacterium]NMD19577.1 hypothetical protein [Verrucomicrobiota bacterium]HNU98716.1 lysoplasmalogenase family protein [Verrucomicrobiota bacterium]